MLTNPLQILLFSAPDCDRAAPFVEGLITTFQGGGSGYLAGADDTGVPIWEYIQSPGDTVADVLAGALHTVAIVLLRQSMVDDPSLMSWLDELGQTAAGRSHAILVVDLDGSQRALSRQAKSLGKVQAVTPDALGEYALRPAILGLIALHRSIEVVSRDSKKLKPKLKLFVSHAKLDGISLAKSLSDLIVTLPGFKSFYDAKDIAPGSDFKQILKEGVENSVLIILRSGQFENRPWCIQEMRWAEQFTSPYLVVDLRHALIVPPAKAPFEQAPTVWVPDGNYYRIIFMALRESLRSRLHVRITEDLQSKIGSKKTYKVLIRQPSMSSLQYLLTGLGTSGSMVIVYPDPPMAAANNDAAQSFVGSLSPGSVLTTPQTLAARAFSGPIS